MTTAPTLTTARLTLRAHRPDDLDALAAMWADERVYRMIGGQPRSREEVWLRLLRSIGQWTAFGYGAWVVERDGTPIGDIGLMDARRAIEPNIDDAPEIGWMLGPSAHGQGYAAEALAAILRWTDAHGIARTACIIDAANAPSIRLAEKMGYAPRCVGRYRDAPINVYDRAAGAGELGQARPCVAPDQARDGARGMPTPFPRLASRTRTWRVMTAAIAILLSAVAMTLIVGARYLAASGGFALATRLRHPGLYAGLDVQMRREIAWSLGSAAIYGVPAGIVAWGWRNLGWTRIYADIHAWPLWYVPVSVLAFLFAHDTWFYWTHRWMHRPAIFRLAHAVHHDSRPPTAWAAMAFHPIEALTGAVVIPLLVFAIPIHVAALGFVLTVMTVMGVTNHMGWEIFPRFMWRGALGDWLITASHHQRHHAQYGCNYGLYFRFWDRLCGTDRGLGDFARDHARAARRSGTGRQDLGDARAGIADGRGAGRAS